MVVSIFYLQVIICFSFFIGQLKNNLLFFIFHKIFFHLFSSYLSSVPVLSFFCSQLFPFFQFLFSPTADYPPHHLISFLFSFVLTSLSLLSPLNLSPPSLHPLSPVPFSLSLSKTAISQGQVELMVFLTSLNLSPHTHVQRRTHTHKCCACQHS